MQISSTRCSRCDETITAAPARPRATIVSFMWRMPSGSRPVSGSSNSSTFGSWMSPQAMASFCFMPRESCRRQRRPLVAELQLLEQRRGPPLEVGDAVDPGDELQVLPHREVVEQLRLVRHERQLSLRLDRLADDVVAGDGDRAGAGRLHADDAAKRRGLACAVRADETDHLARARRRRRGR